MSTQKKTEGPVKCTWHLGTQEPSPHKHYRNPRNPKILENVLGAIGYTPLVRLNKIPQEEGLECEIVAKCEYFNAGGSVKDRIGLRMVEDAERSGRIKPGDTLIEPTSGNTGIGLALAAAIKGYRMIITLPEKMSKEKVDVLKGLGAEIIRTPTEAAWDAPESHIGVARRLNKEIPNSHILDQYGNPSNPLAHYDTTAEEILEQTEGKIDLIVLTAGTGGTLTGIARKMKERLPNVKIVGVDPEGSILAQPESLNQSGVGTYKVEGIGYDFVPVVLDRSDTLVDKWIKTVDRESFNMSRRLIRSEGLLCGGSAGSCMAGAVRAAREYGMKKGDRVVVLLADSVRNYMSKFLSDDWMAENGFTDTETKERQKTEVEQYHGATIKTLNLPNAVTCSIKTNVQEALNLLNRGGFDQLPVVDDSKRMVGLVTTGNLLSKFGRGLVQSSDSVQKVMFTFNTKRNFKEITSETPLSDLNRFFEFNSAAFVTERENDVPVVKKVVTKVDLLQYLIKNPEFKFTENNRA